jgi:hypothetical protein
MVNRYSKRKPDNSRNMISCRLIPIASVIIPGTLSVAVDNARPLNVTKLDVPGLDFRSLKFARQLTTPTNDQPNRFFSTFDYAGSHRQILQTAHAVTIGGAILPIPPPAPNSTWISTFFGPSLSCTRVQGEDLQAFLSNVARYVASGALR